MFKALDFESAINHVFFNLLVLFLIFNFFFLVSLTMLPKLACKFNDPSVSASHCRLELSLCVEFSQGRLHNN